MSTFDRARVLKTILKEVTVKQNLRGEIQVNGGRQVIYAFYCNRGMPDPDLKYDRYKNPIPTSPDSTLCEIYSVGGPKHAKFEQEHLQRLKDSVDYANSQMETSRLYNRPSQRLQMGPWVDGVGTTDDEIIKLTRGKGLFERTYNFHHSEAWFREHFNNVCMTLGIDIRLERNFVETESKQSRLEIDLARIDPTLSQILELTEKAYKKIS